MNTNLNQAEANALLALEKRRVSQERHDYPGLGGRVSIPLVSADRRESFSLDLRRARFDLAKGTYQNRGRHTVTLARLDFGGAPHRNPDGGKSGLRTSICTVKDMQTNGRIQFQKTNSWI